MNLQNSFITKLVRPIDRSPCNENFISFFETINSDGVRQDIVLSPRLVQEDYVS
jgi:hypothetical protein